MTQETTSKAKSCLMGCGIAALVPVVLLVLAAVIFTVNNRPPKIVIPSHSVPKDNGWDWFVRAADAGKRLGPASDPQGANWTMADYELFIKDNAASFAIQRQALDKPCVCPAFRGNKPIYSKFESSAKIRELARTLQGEAMYYEKIGDFGRAVDCQLDCVEMGVSMASKGSLLQELVAIAVESIGMSKICDRIPRLNKAELARVAARVERIQKKRVPYSGIVLEEGYETASSWAATFNDQEYRQLLLDPRNWPAQSVGTPMGSPKSLEYFEGAKIAFANKTGIIKQILSFSKDLSSEVVKPYVGKSKVPIPGNAIAAMGCENMINVWCLHLKCEANLALLQTEIAIRRFNADNGRYPDKLNQLVPKYLKSVPVDQFGGKPLRYVSSNKGKSFKLYSIGPDLKDNGGAGVRISNWAVPGDIVLGTP